MLATPHACLATPYRLLATPLASLATPHRFLATAHRLLANTHPCLTTRFLVTSTCVNLVFHQIYSLHLLQTHKRVLYRVLAPRIKKKTGFTTPGHIILQSALGHPHTTALTLSKIVNSFLFLGHAHVSGFDYSDSDAHGKVTVLSTGRKFGCLY